MQAFKGGVSIVDEASLNMLLRGSSFAEIWAGNLKDSKTGTGVVENSLALYNYAIRITPVGVTEIGRIEFELDRDNLGADVVVEIRGTDFNPDGTNEGTLLRSIILPKEFIPTTNAHVSVPIDLTGLTAGANYWAILKKAGDATNKIDIIGETAQDESHPCYYRSADSGAWTITNALHFKLYDGTCIGDYPKHIIYDGQAYKTFEFSGEYPSKLYIFIPPPTGTDGGIRQIFTYTWSGEYFKRGVVS